MFKTIFRCTPTLSDVYDSILPFHSFSRIFLISNFKIVCYNDRKFYEICWFSLILRLVTFCAIIGYLLNYQQQYYEVKKNFSDFVSFGCFVVTTFISICCTVIDSISIKSVSSIYNDINTIDLKLEYLGIRPPHWFVLM